MGALMAEASASVRRRVRRKVPPQDAPDVEQDIWLRMYLALLDWPQDENAMLLLSTVLRRSVADYWRHARVHSPPAQVAPAGSPGADDGLSGGSYFDALGEALADLPAHYRAVLQARLVEDLPLAGIAQRLGLREGTVKSRLHQGRRLLQQHLGPRNRPPFCEDLAACPLGLGWGLRSLASIDIVAMHLATCASCHAQWRRLERLCADPLLAAQDGAWSLRVVLRVQADLSIWLEGDIQPPHAASDRVRVGIGAAAGRLRRLSDDQGRNLGPGMGFVEGADGAPDRLMTETASRGRLRFVHHVPAERARKLGLLETHGTRHVLRYRNIPTYDRTQHVMSAVLVALRPAAALGGATPRPTAREAAFGRKWLAFTKDCPGGAEHAFSVTFSI